MAGGYSNARTLPAALLLAALSGCGQPADDAQPPAQAEPAKATYYGTNEPFAAEAIYFVLTDRFVNGDSSNDYREQGGERHTFDRPLPHPEPDAQPPNVGYLGGDFKGLLAHADYIAEMGFGAVWITPIVDNPNEAFSGGDEISWTSFLSDRGKAGYHGYWGVNFYHLDEHLPSADLGFPEFTAGMHAKGLKVVLDIVANHGSPSFSMPADQPMFGEVYGADGTLLADHQNLPPEQLDPQNNRLHSYFHAEPDLAQLSNFDDTSAEVMDYLSGAYLQWIGQGVDALRIDTIRHMPLPFWKAFSDRIRDQHPGMFMFGEAFDYEAAKIAPFTLPENGAISVLDFPLKAAMNEVFGTEGKGYERLAEALFLRDGPYHNPYDLVTFYDNHDMARMEASDEGFIDAHHWLFTARGIPAVYYGSEIGFERGRAEHQGNRNYFGVERIAQAQTHPIRQALSRIAQLRAASPALQKGLQLNLLLEGDRAAFYRLYSDGEQAQTALVLLNKGAEAADFVIDQWLQAGQWYSGLDDSVIDVVDGGSLSASVPAHGVQVYLLDQPAAGADLLKQIALAQAGLPHRSAE